MLGYHPVETRILIGQWRQDLVGLERKLQRELDEGSQILSPRNLGQRSRRPQHQRGMNEPQFNKDVSA